jgi:transcriptional regulator with XRE-family HTH domain
MLKPLDDYTDISVRFKEVRAKSGVTQKEFGKVLGLSSPAVGAIENGKYTPSFAVLRRMRIHYNVDYNWFIDGRKNGKNLEAKFALLNEEVERLKKALDKLLS